MRRIVEKLENTFDTRLASCRFTRWLIKIGHSPGSETVQAFRYGIGGDANIENQFVYGSPLPMSKDDLGPFDPPDAGTCAFGESPDPRFHLLGSFFY